MADEFLKVTGGNAAGTEIPLDDGLLIGRDVGGEGSLKGDSELSREHARITRAGDGDFLIEDLDSTNGTFVNGERITKAIAIRLGDTISVGQTTLDVAGKVVRGIQATAVAADVGKPPIESTRVVPRPAEASPPAGGAPPPAAPPPGAGAPPPGAGGPPPTAAPPAGVGGPPAAAGPPPGAGGPPPGVTGPPPGAGGPPPGVTGPPPGAAGPPQGAGAMPPAMTARLRKMAFLAAFVGLLIGFAVAAAVFNLL